MPVYMPRTLHIPVFQIFFIPPALIADPAFRFAILVLSGGNSNDFITLHPKHHLAAAFLTIVFAGGVYRLGEPNAAGKAGSSVGQGTNRANIYDVSIELIVQ